MRRIERTGAFHRDFRREKSGQHRRDIDFLVFDIVSLPADDKSLSDKNRNHGLSGDWSDHTANAI